MGRETGVKGEMVERQWQGRSVLMGDFKDLSSRWNLRSQVLQNAASWEPVIHENGLEIGHEGRSTHYWRRDEQKGELAIDLTLANWPIMKLAILPDDDATGS